MNETSQERFLARELARGGLRTSARALIVHDGRVLFFVDNRFDVAGGSLHFHEHYFAVALEHDDVRSREDDIVVLWLPLTELPHRDVRPTVVRDALAEDRHREVRYLVSR
ncbi:MAG: hypothetical protein AAF533_29130 [Acidobacteriota bacterium]